GGPGEGREVVDDREDQAVTVPALATGAGRGDLRGAHPRRRPRGCVLLEEAGLLDAVRPPDAGDRTVLQQRQEHGRDLGVVAEHLALRGAGAGVEHLVEVGQLEGAALDVDPHLLAAARTHLPTAITGTLAGSRRHISLFRKERGALTHPAVAPLPLTCRKIPAPRWRTWAWL